MNLKNSENFPVKSQPSSLHTEESGQSTEQFTPFKCSDITPEEVRHLRALTLSSWHHYYRRKRVKELAVSSSRLLAIGLATTLVLSQASPLIGSLPESVTQKILSSGLLSWISH